jgi:hypothetical protein
LRSAGNPRKPLTFSLKPDWRKSSVASHGQAFPPFFLRGILAVRFCLYQANARRSQTGGWRKRLDFIVTEIQVFPFFRRQAVLAGNYVVRWYSNLMTPVEKRTINHLYSSMKAAPMKSDIETQSEHEKAAGRYRFFTDLISDDADVLHLTEGRFEGFIERTSARILDESRHLIFFNRSPKCAKPARADLFHEIRLATIRYRNVNECELVITSPIEGSLQTR